MCLWGLQKRIFPAGSIGILFELLVRQGMLFKDKFLFALRIFLLMAALTFIALGVFRDEPFDIFLKASNICLECIGIG